MSYASSLRRQKYLCVAVFIVDCCSASYETPVGGSGCLRLRKEVRKLKHRPAESEHLEW